MAETEQQVLANYRGMKSEIQQLVEKISELEVDVSEHQRVLETLKPLEKSRKAFRMIGGVLVQRTVEDVLPAVEKNCIGITQVLKQLNDTIAEKEKQANAYQRKYNIQVQK